MAFSIRSAGQILRKLTGPFFAIRLVSRSCQLLPLLNCPRQGPRLSTTALKFTAICENWLGWLFELVHEERLSIDRHPENTLARTPNSSFVQ
jgi:hypothetical protein